MKKFILFLLTIAMCLSLMGCSLIPGMSDPLPDVIIDEVETTVPEESTEITISTESTEDEIPSLNENALNILQSIVDNHVADENFIDVILANVPDVFMLTDYRAEEWTYFLVMNDGIEYKVIIDYDGTITSIFYWDADLEVETLNIYIWSE